MTPEQSALIAALNACTLAPAGWDKRFCRSLADAPLNRELSEKQTTQLERMRQRYRRQLRHIAPALMADLPDKPTKCQLDSSASDLEKLRAWEAGEPIPTKRR